MDARRRLVLALVVVPFAVAGGALLWLVAVHGTGAMLGAPIHEDGRRSLLATILYPRHFLREIPVAAFYVFMAAAALRTYGPVGGASGRVRRGPAVAAIALAVGGLVAAAFEAGPTTAAWDALQAYVRDDTWTYGGHWRAHFLSGLGYLAAAVVTASAIGYGLQGTWPLPRSRRWLGATLAAFGIVTLLCRPSAEPFRDPRCIGHQARELATHVLVTLPLVAAVLLTATAPAAATAGTRRPPAEALLALVAGVAIAGFLGARTIVTGAVETARPGVDASRLLGVHVFEHALDYVFVTLLAAAVAGRREPG